MAKKNDLIDQLGGDVAATMAAVRSGNPSGLVPGGSVASTGGKNAGVGRLKGAVEIEISRIIPDPENPRREFPEESIERLAKSIAKHGVLQPVGVRYIESMDRFMLAMGERRLMGAIKSGRKTIPAIIFDGERTAEQWSELAILENCQREDLPDLDAARAYKSLMDRKGWTAATLAEELHLTGASISRALKLLTLPSEIQAAIESGNMTPSAAYEVSKVADPEEQAALAAHVMSEGLSRAETIKVVREAAKRSPKASGSKGRGAGKPKAEKAPTIRKYRSTTTSVKITAESRKGIELATLAMVLREWLEVIEGQGEARDAA